MRTEFMGKCDKTAIMGANPEDFPQDAPDLLLSGRMKAALRNFKGRMRGKRSRRRLALSIASAGFARPRTNINMGRVRKRPLQIRSIQGNLTYARKAA